MKKYKSEFIPEFKTSMLFPRHWLTWGGIAIIAIFAIIPASQRDFFLGKLGKIVGRIGRNARHRALVNLSLCFPEYSESEREHIVDSMFSTAPQAIAMMAELAILGPKKITGRIQWNGLDIVENMKKNNEKVIFLVPHTWSVDIPAMLMATQGIKMAAMFHNQKQTVIDYVWNKVRRRFGGRLHARNDGIKPFIQSVRQGYWGYYLPDQDHGPLVSEFADFFATYKATLPVIGRLKRISGAQIIPLFSVYNSKTHQLNIHILPPLNVPYDASNAIIARQINMVVENCVYNNIEQYTWILKLLKTRKPGENEPY